VDPKILVGVLDPPAPVVTWNTTGASVYPQDVPSGQVTDITNALNGLAGDR